MTTSWPEHSPREKGVDVALAITLVESAMLNEYDVAIVFSGDTDLIPAVEMAFHRTTPKVEIAAWSEAKPLWFPAEMAAGRMLPWCHFLGQQDFDAVRDQQSTSPSPEAWPCQQLLMALAGSANLRRPRASLNLRRRHLENVLSHFTDNVVFTSPVATQFLDDSGSVIAVRLR